MKNISIKKFVLVIVGSISIMLGVVGIFLPILPTTPFLLLSAYCYAKSSKKMYLWLMNNKLFGNYIQNYVNYKSISTRHRVITFLLLWSMMIASIILVGNFHFTILLLIIGCGVSIHLITLKNIKVYRNKK